MAFKRNKGALKRDMAEPDGMETVAQVPADEETVMSETEYSSRKRTQDAQPAEEKDFFDDDEPDDEVASGQGAAAEDGADNPGTDNPDGDTASHEDNDPDMEKRQADKRRQAKRKGARQPRRSAKRPQKKSAPVDPRQAALEKKRRRQGILAGTLVSALALVLALVLALDMTGHSTMISGPLATVLAPLQSAAASVSASIREKIDAFGDTLELERELTKSEQELAAASVKLSRYDEVVAENERLLALMDNYEKYSEYDPMFARVIGKDMGNWTTDFTVDKGTSSGVEKGMTVMSADGVVGRVVEVGLNYAKVMTIVDGSSGVAVLIERNRDNGVVRGMVDDTTGEYMLQMNYLVDINDVRTGDTVLTSGLDGVFPKGLPIGTVTQISRQSSTLSQYVVVTPYADFEHVEGVLLLKLQS